jgi:hypothetical protein
VWDYAERSARLIFGTRRTGLPPADAILEALRQRSLMTRTEISGLFSRNVPAADIDAALAVLEDKRLAKRSQQTPEGGKGRPVEIWQATA